MYFEEFNAFFYSGSFFEKECVMKVQLTRSIVKCFFYVLAGFLTSIVRSFTFHL